jgi:cyanophycin synthetase
MSVKPQTEPAAESCPPAAGAPRDGASAMSPAPASSEAVPGAASGTESPVDAELEPPRAFSDSRRLIGAGRDHAGPAVTLTPLGSARHDPPAHAAWARRVLTLAQRLAWPDPQPVVRPDEDEPALIFAAPAGCLFTATELNEWAWERSAAESAGAIGADASGSEGFFACQPASDDEEEVCAHFAAMAQREWRADLAALRSAAAERGLPWVEDDAQASIGSGQGARVWTHTRPPPATAPDAQPIRVPLPEPAAVPWPALHAVPTALVTGSNGKTTTVRLLAAMAQAAGRVAGANTTEGVVVGGRAVAEGDYAGPAGARAVLRHPAVQVAVLETARGGLLRRGLALDRASVAVVTGIAADHFGEYGIRSLQDLAEVKLIVARTLAPLAGAADSADSAGEAGAVIAGADALARAGHPGPCPDAPGGWLVLNADDALLLATARRLPHARAARWALFAGSLSHPALQSCAAVGGPICGVHQGRLLLVVPGEPVYDLGEPADLPITLGGAAAHNLSNAAAAALAAHCLGLPLRAIAAALARFGADPEDNPGRLEHWRWRGATVIVDYAHNPDGLTHLLAVAQRLLDLGSRAMPGRLAVADDGAAAEGEGRAADGARAVHPNGASSSTGSLSLLLGQAGNRSDAEIAALARAAAAARPAHIVIKELPQMRRGRAAGEVSALLQAALRAAGVPVERLTQEPDELSAAQRLLEAATPGDVVVLPVHTAAVRRALAERLRSGD